MLRELLLPAGCKRKAVSTTGLRALRHRNESVDSREHTAVFPYRDDCSSCVWKPLGRPGDNTAQCNSTYRGLERLAGSSGTMGWKPVCLHE